MDLIKEYKIERIDKSKTEYISDYVIEENPLDIYIEDKIVSTLMCTPSDLYYLVIGQIYSLGFINSASDIKDIIMGEGYAKVYLNDKKSERREYDYKKITLEREKVFDLSKRFQANSEVFKYTGGAHSCALIKDYEIIKFEEDVARNNAVDKLIGFILKEEIDIGDKLIFTSCRVSDLIVDKVLNIGFKTIISQSCPTSISVDIAKDQDINLIGFARGDRFNVYNKTDTLKII